MVKRGANVYDESINLRKLGSYQEMEKGLEKIIRQILREDMNALTVRNELKRLVTQIIFEVTNYEFTFLKMLSCLEPPQKFLSHSLNTAIFSYIIASDMNVKLQMLPKVIEAALLHDIGKLNFNHKLKELYVHSGDDIKQVKMNHPVWGERILLMHLKIDPGTANLVRNHHEQNDGTGFPRGLKGTDMGICDHILNTANLLDNTLQMINYSCLENLAQSMKMIMDNYPQKFLPQIRNVLTRMLAQEKEVRKYRRYPVSANGKIESGTMNLVTPCEIYNISTGGIGVATPVVLNTGIAYKVSSRISADILLKDKMCRVRWDKLSEGKFCYGMKFETPSDLAFAKFFAIS